MYHIEICYKKQRFTCNLIGNQYNCICKSFIYLLIDMIGIEYDWMVFSRMNNWYYYWEKRIDGKRIKLSLHRYTRSKHNWEIPNWWVIHHKDWNKENNVIDNLELMNKSQHLSIHQVEKMKDEVYKTKLVKQLMDVNDLAKAWHWTEEWKRWHKQHWKNCWTEDKRKKRETTKICKNCWKEYNTLLPSSMYCSHKCNQKYKNKTWYYNTDKRICKFCWEEFITNRFRKTQYCWYSCASKDKKNNK